MERQIVGMTRTSGVCTRLAGDYLNRRCVVPIKD